MRAIGLELLKENRRILKFIVNDSGIAFFPGNEEHRDNKFDGLSYEDNYEGNALAGLIAPQRVEIRFHQAFPDERVRNIWAEVLKIPEVAAARLGALYYQGRLIG